MRLFIARTILGVLGTWLATIVLPVRGDSDLRTYLLMGLFLGIGEVILIFVQQIAAIILFFIPRSIRNFLLRACLVLIAAALTSGFGFEPPLNNQLIGLGGTTLLLSLLYSLPFSS